MPKRMAKCLLNEAAVSSFAAIAGSNSEETPLIPRACGVAVAHEFNAK